MFAPDITLQAGTNATKNAHLVSNCAGMADGKFDNRDDAFEGLRKWLSDKRQQSNEHK